MKYIEGTDARQLMLLPFSIDEWIAEDNPIRVIEAFVNELDIEGLGFKRDQPAATSRPGYDPRDQ